MKQKLLSCFRIRTILIISLLSTLFVGNAWAQTTVETTSFSAINGNVGDDSKVTYASYKGGGTSNPAINSGAIRLYQNSSGTTGGYVVIGVPENYEIKSATIRSTMATTTGYKLVDSDPSGTTPVKNTFNVSNYSLSANTDYTVNDISSRYIVFACFGTSSSSRLYLSKISITYASTGGGDTPTTYTVSYNANGGTGTMEDSNSPYASGATVTVLDNEFTRDGYEFTSWNTAANGSGTYYDEGDEFEISANTILYAQWEEVLSANTQKLTFDVSSNPGGWPNSNPTTLTNYTYTLNNVNYTFALNNVKCNSGYLMLTSTAVLGLPALEGYKLTKVVAHNSSGCSTTTVVGISSSSDSGDYIAGGTTQTWSTTGSTYTYNLTSTEANTMYYLYVTNKNAQIIQLDLYYEEDNNTPAPSFTISNNNEIAYDATSGSFNFTVNNGVTGGITTVSENVDWISNPGISGNSVTFTTTANEANTSREGVITLTYTYNTNETVTKDVTITQAAAPAPEISASDVDIAYNATSGSIDYTLANATGNVTATVTSGNWLTLGTITSSEVPFTCSANTETTARTATVTLSYTGADDKVVTVTQTAAPLTTMDQIFAAATSAGTTATDCYVTFNNWVVSAVKNNQAFVTDGTKGLIIYENSHGFAVGNILSGTVACKVKLYNGSSELTSLTSSTSGLTVTTGGTVTSQVVDITDLSGVNTGALIQVNGVTYDATNTVLKDASNNEITPYNSLYNDMSFSDGSTYNVTGVYLQFTTTNTDKKEILPRSAADIEEVVANAQPLTVSATNGSVEITGKTLTNNACEVAEGATVEATATPAEHYTFTSWSATGVTLADNTVNPLTFTMPTNGVTLTANFTENAKYTATFNVLGTVVGTDANVYEGEAITFPNVTAPTGYTFMGWTTSAIVGSQNAAPETLVTSANMGSADVDYYAVFAVGTVSGEGTIELTNSTIQNSRTGKTSYGTYTIDDWSGKFMINKNGETYSLQLGYNAGTTASAYNSHLTTPECASNIKSITINTNNNTASGRTFYLCSADDLGTASSTDATYGYGSTSAQNGSVTITVSGNTKQFHIYPDGTAYIASVSLTYSSLSYSGYCTSITEDITVLSAAEGLGTYVTTNALDFANCTDFYAYKATVSGNTVTFDKVTQVPARTPLLVRSTAAFGNNETSRTISVPVISTAASIDNALVAGPGTTVASQSDGSYNYVLTTKNGAVGFYLANNKTVPTNKAYLQVPTSAFAGGANVFIGFDFDGEVTSIETIQSEELRMKSEEWFTLDGRRLNGKPTQRGLYIVNGQKVVIK